MSQATHAAELLELPAEQYHADRGRWSKGMLFSFMQRREKLFREHFRGEGPHRSTTPAMEFGTLVHAATLEPHKLDGEFAVIPSALLSSDGKATTKAAKEFAELHRSLGKIIVKQSDLDAANAMAANVRAQIGKLIDADTTHIESVVQWTDAATGVACRCRPDLLSLATPGRPLIVDLKTTDDPTPEEFGRVSDSLGYWLQDAHYSAGVEALTGAEPQFLFCVVETSWPYAVAFYEYETAAADEAVATYDKTLAAVARCQASGDWSDPWAGQVNWLSLKPWSLASGRRK